MMPSCAVVLFSTLFMFAVWLECHGHEFTFELPDNEKMCFYEVLKKDVKSTLEFQVSYERMQGLWVNVRGCGLLRAASVTKS